ncbi:murein transglycosylase A [Tropicimonas isoalkanivorans]|uniref:peptidoglycan lytic exotransglycosylase n=1 Tax=Tropicimonas isoalkanivorans TaxID=441112 RepID=A0A1I1MHW3_9RHOB|nr:MltA domain-containing protein [Tropicimonas isoalkanivorans]SFC81140.1 membrane-bound lytic murein transglycosylase A [Tropicimonas isoalkanivorans]
MSFTRPDGAATPTPHANAPSSAKRTRLSFGALDGWEDDDHAAALTAFRATSDLPVGPQWQAAHRAARAATDARAFFEKHFEPVLIGAVTPGLFTGYYEPELDGALAPTDRFRAPIYATPPEMSASPWATRAEIEAGTLLTGQGLEIAWLEDPVEAFFLQIQGSGRIRLPDGTAIRVGFDAKNGHPYRSIGQELVRRGIFDATTVSAQAVKDWLRANPEAGRLLMQVNDSFVFFRTLTGIPPDSGPPGAMGRPVTAHRTLAVDPAFTPLGAPVWLETDGPAPIRRLMIAQDVGSAIKGPQRGDIFYGTGAHAGEAAGNMRDPGRMIVLEPVSPRT